MSDFREFRGMAKISRARIARIMGCPARLTGAGHVGEFGPIDISPGAHRRRIHSGRNVSKMTSSNGAAGHPAMRAAIHRASSATFRRRIATPTGAETLIPLHAADSGGRRPEDARVFSPSERRVPPGLAFIARQLAVVNRGAVVRLSFLGEKVPRSVQAMSGWAHVWVLTVRAKL